MAAGDMPIGLDGKMYYGDAGATPDTEATEVDDVNIKLSARLAEAIRRGKKFVTKKPSVLEAQLTFKIFVVEGDAFRVALRSAYMNKTRLAIYPTEEESGEGPNCDWYVTEFSEAQPNPDFLAHTVTCELTEELRDFSWA